MEQVEKKMFAEFIADTQMIGGSVYQDKMFISDMYWIAEERLNKLPLRLDAFTIIMVERGELTIYIDYQLHRLRENMFLTLIDRHIVQQGSVSTDFKGYHLVGAHDFIRGVTEQERPSGNPFRMSPVVQLHADEFALLRDNLERLRRNVHRNDHAYQHKLVRNELANLLFESWNFRKNRLGDEAADGKSTPQNNVVMAFFELLFKHVREKHDVAFYAEELHVTSVYLSRAVKHVTGKPAIKIINDILLTEAQLLLRKPDVSILQISEDLNFADQSSFSKFFKNHTGEAPLAYRKKMG